MAAALNVYGKVTARTVLYEKVQLIVRQNVATLRHRGSQGAILQQAGVVSVTVDPENRALQRVTFDTGEIWVVERTKRPCCGG
jgi:hypothetical protein